MKSLSTGTAPPLLLQASTTRPLRALLPRLLRSLRSSGSFIHQRRASSSRAVSLSLELQRHATADTYASLLASGLELHRSAHTALASLCPPDSRPLRRGSSSLIEIQLDIRSLDRFHGRLFAATRAISA
ncbi:MAG: hypothetical protein NVSMB3_01000 [Acidobacteriaceae bacterium]